MSAQSRLATATPSAPVEPQRAAPGSIPAAETAGKLFVMETARPVTVAVATVHGHAQAVLVMGTPRPLAQSAA